MPEDALPVSQEFCDTESRRRWLKLQEPNALELLHVLPIDDLATTSIAELQGLTDLPELAVRGGLEVLADGAALTSSAGDVAERTVPRLAKAWPRAPARSLSPSGLERGLVA